MLVAILQAKIKGLCKFYRKLSEFLNKSQGVSGKKDSIQLETLVHS
jgi:hypothetical protein